MDKRLKIILLAVFVLLVPDVTAMSARLQVTRNSGLSPMNLDINCTAISPGENAIYTLRFADIHADNVVSYAPIQLKDYVIRTGTTITLNLVCMVNDSSGIRYDTEQIIVAGDGTSPDFVTGIPAGTGSGGSGVMELVSVDVKGNTGYSGYTSKRENDYLLIEAMVDGNGLAVATDNVRIGTDYRTAILFQSCTLIGNATERYLCTYQEPVGLMRAGTYAVNVWLNGVSSELQINIDDSSPVIETTRLSSGSDPGSLAIEFDYSDKLCSTCGTSRCSGIGMVELFKEDLSSDPLVIQNDSSMGSACEGTGRIMQNLTDLVTDGTSGNISFWVRATDNAGNRGSPVLIEYHYDLTSPRFSGMELLVDGKTVQYIKNSATAVIKVNYTDDTGIETAYADLSSLAGNGAWNQGTCTGGKTGTCVWNSVNLDGSVDGQIDVNGTDPNGNTASASFPVSVAEDNTGPTDAVLYGKVVIDGVTYANGYNSTFYMDVTDAGIGMSLAKVQVSFSTLNPEQYSSPVKADKCEFLQGVWHCEWTGIKASRSGTYDIITLSVKDDLDNLMTTDNPVIRVKADVEAPVINSAVVNCTSVGNSIRTGSGQCAEGDIMTIAVNFSDETPVTAVINTSSIFGTGLQQMNCEGDICSLTTQEIPDIGTRGKQFSLRVNLSDGTGNYKEADVKVHVLNKLNGTVDYWTMEVKEIQPNQIDRSIAELIEQKAYVTLHIKSKSGRDTDSSLEVVGLNFEGCLGIPVYDLDSSQFLHGDPAAWNAIGNSRNPVLVFTFETTQFEVNSLSYNCSFNIQSRDGDELRDPEEEEIIVEIPFYNMPAGEAGLAVQEKIDAEKSRWVHSSAIKTLSKLFDTAGQICRMLNTLGEVQTIFSGVHDALVAPARLSAGVESARVKVAEGTSVMGDTGKKLYGALDKYCKWLNCQGTEKMLGFNPGSGRELMESSDMGLEGLGKFLDDKGLAYTFTTGTDKKTGNKVQIRVQDGKDIVPSGAGVDDVTYTQAMVQKLPIKESGILSLYSGCLPGVIYNIDKMRQVSCSYIDCLQSGVGSSAVGVQVCDEIKGTGECKYFWGELFNFLPFTSMMDYYLGGLQEVLGDPLSAIGVVAGATCRPHIADAVEFTHCKALEYLKAAGQMINSANSVMDKDTWKIKKDFCSEVGM